LADLEPILLLDSSVAPRDESGPRYPPATMVTAPPSTARKPRISGAFVVLGVPSGLPPGRRAVPAPRIAPEVPPHVQAERERRRLVDATTVVAKGQRRTVGEACLTTANTA
jgi:hypothetical protein